MVTSAQPALPRSRVGLVCALVFCIYEALPKRLTSLRTIDGSGPQERDFVLIFGLMFTIFILTSIAIRSSFARDQIAFGAAAVGVLLQLFIRLVLPTPSTAAVIGGIVSLAWTVAGVCILVTLVTAWRRGAET